MGSSWIPHPRFPKINPALQNAAKKKVNIRKNSALKEQQHYPRGKFTCCPQTHTHASIAIIARGYHTWRYRLGFLFF